jgi:hypothetical protein
MQTLAAKRSFEAYSASHGVKVQQYHADNGRFAEHLFLNHCEKAGQKVSLSGVSVHFQNGIAERRIKDLTERSRTSLLHAIHRWPSAVTINLWPYALRYINEVYNATPALKTGKSPLEAFSQTAISPRSWISTHLSVPSMCYTTDSKAVDHALSSGSDDQGQSSS